MDGLGDRPGPGRKPRITQEQRSQIIALVKTTPPGRLRWEPWGEVAASGVRKLVDSGVWVAIATRRVSEGRRHAPSCSTAPAAASG
ncbi:hypothetical protein ACQPYK_16295 [Streptosporangium sp. CA-135522]|uniref:hypothetical protein n=1 Tax=Streptosporangium sp. CA-135522 TaxID=3240072 RepID=UPI003D92569F